MKLKREFDNLFGSEDRASIPSHCMKQILRMAWAGSMCAPEIRAFCWRVLLGLVSRTDKNMWRSELDATVSNYDTIKKEMMPSLDKVDVDPLSGFSVGASQNTQWNKYYQSVELTNFIKGDLDRLFITGIEDDDYFQTPRRRNILLAVLVIWAMQHPVVSYRQGMHEIAGYVLHCVETERFAWEEAAHLHEGDFPVGHSLHEAFTLNTVEAHTFKIFSRIMNELEPLYDPTTSNSYRAGIEHQPFVVQYCTKIQEHYLRMLDPDLCDHLEDSFVQAQLYGLRWSRLMLGREFTVADSQVYKLWDYIFACCYEAEYLPADTLLDDDSPPNIYSVLAYVRISGFNQNSNIERRRKAIEQRLLEMKEEEHSSSTDDITAPARGEISPQSYASLPQYVCTPLLAALADFMLAMLLQIRQDLIEADSTMVMGYLMRYPEQDSVIPIINLADMIRRGVIIKEAHLGGDARRPSEVFVGGPGAVAGSKALAASYALSIRANGNPQAPLVVKEQRGTKLSHYSQSRRSSQMESAEEGTGGWLNPSSINNMGKKMTDRLNAMGAIMNNGINGLVNNIVTNDGAEGPRQHNIRRGSNTSTGSANSNFRNVSTFSVYDNLEDDLAAPTGVTRNSSDGLGVGLSNGIDAKVNDDNESKGKLQIITPSSNNSNIDNSESELLRRYGRKPKKLLGSPTGLEMDDYDDKSDDSGDLEGSPDPLSGHKNSGGKVEVAKDDGGINSVQKKLRRKQGRVSHLLSPNNWFSSNSEPKMERRHTKRQASVSSTGVNMGVLQAAIKEWDAEQLKKSHEHTGPTEDTALADDTIADLDIPLIPIDEVCKRLSDIADNVEGAPADDNLASNRVELVRRLRLLTDVLLHKMSVSVYDSIVDGKSSPMVPSTSAGEDAELNMGSSDIPIAHDSQLLAVMNNNASSDSIDSESSSSADDHTPVQSNISAEELQPIDIVSKDSKRQSIFDDPLR